MSAQVARYWAEPLLFDLAAYGLTPAGFGELAGGERLRVLARLERLNIDAELERRRLKRGR